MFMLLLAIVFVLTATITIKRLRRRSTLIVPATLSVLALGWGAWAIFALVRLFEQVAHLAPEDKATILANGISEALKPSGLHLLVAAGVLTSAVLLDRRLRTAKTALQAARAAPPGSRCARHSERIAPYSCGRCGNFTCDTCLRPKLGACSACEERLAHAA